ncbi:MAG: hypothetical protein PHQ18_02350 [Patescibacteria group bacterium]|nr:hypothetical protein [Patescibacteria group bacterium]
MNCQCGHQNVTAGQPCPQCGTTNLQVQQQVRFQAPPAITYQPVQGQQPPAAAQQQTTRRFSWLGLIGTILGALALLFFIIFVPIALSRSGDNEDKIAANTTSLMTHDAAIAANTAHLRVILPAFAPGGIIDTMNNGIAKNSTDIAANTTDLVDAGKAYDKLEKRVDKHDTRLTKVEGDVASLDAKVRRVSTRVSNYQAEATKEHARLGSESAANKAALDAIWAELSEPVGSIERID